MYQDSQVTTPLVFDPSATIVIADRAMEFNDTNYGKSVEMTAEDISNKLRSGYLHNRNYEARTKQISSAISAIRDTAAETDNEELIEFLQELADILNITLTKSYRVALSFSAYAEVELPLGTDSDEITYDDFEIELSSSNSDVELRDWELSDSQIDYIEPIE